MNTHESHPIPSIPMSGRLVQDRLRDLYYDTSQVFALLVFVTGSSPQFKDEHPTTTSPVVERPPAVATASDSALTIASTVHPHEGMHARAVLAPRLLVEAALDITFTLEAVKGAGTQVLGTLKGTDCTTQGTPGRIVAQSGPLAEVTDNSAGAADIGAFLDAERAYRVHLDDMLAAPSLQASAALLGVCLTTEVEPGTMSSYSQ